MSIGALPSRPAAAAGESRAAPTVVLAYAGSGAGRLRSELSAYPDLACTTGTGIVPLCAQAAATWQAVDRRAGQGTSPLGLASVRTFIVGAVTAILAREGGRRWCEFISAPPAVAGAFAALYPQARFLTVHRQAGAVVRAVLDENRWGLSGPEFAPFVSAYPASTVSALASYWAARTAQQLDFEHAHRGSCLPVRIEDLNTDPVRAMRDISDFLALGAKDTSPSLTHDEPWSWPAGDDDSCTGLPLDQIPASLQARINELQHSLGYPPLTAAAA